jgi:uncharacterized protein (DUF58 family)
VRFTPRSWALAVVALLLYVSANQTQVGWLYVMAALAAGVWLAGWLFSPGRMLRGLTLRRRINGSAATEDLELYAGQPVTIDLQVQNGSRLPAWQVRLQDECPLAISAERRQAGFVSFIPPRSPLTLTYTAQPRRGAFEVPPVQLATRAPLGLFAANRHLLAPAQGLVLPEYRELSQLPLLDRMPAAEAALARAGAGGEVLGVREYRPGDSRRHIHWRSSARAGRLIVKEFAEETQPGLTLALDLRGASVIGSDENTSLELAIKVAATLARYATQRSLPVRLAVNSRHWPAPEGPVDWWTLMAYLAQVQGEGNEPFDACLSLLPPSTFVGAILTAPDPAVVAPLAELGRWGPGVLAVVVDPAPFGGEAGLAPALADRLMAQGVEACIVGDAPDWERALEGDQ